MTALAKLRALGTGSEPPIEAKQRVYRSVLAAIDAAAATGAGGAALAKRPPSSPPALQLASLARSKAALIAAGIWLFGGATGAVLYGAFRPEPVRVVYVERPLPSASVVTPQAEPVAAAPLPLRVAPVVSGVGPAPAASSGKRANVAPFDGSSELARERALLDVARERAAHGEPALVLEQTEQHRSQFPQGQLSEEREALAIRALIALDRRDEARARAQLFRASYPNSFLTPVLDSALAVP